MIVEAGHYALVLALALAVYQSVVPLYGAQRGDQRLMQVAVPASLGQLFLVAIAFAALTYAYVVSDFSVRNVWANSHSAKPLIYKISGVWGNHEGSLILWVLILALFGALVAVFGRNLPPGLKARTLSVQAMIAVAFLLFTLLTSNPFERLDQIPIDGRGLNPILQDPALAIHPPLLYAGYVGLSISFAFAVAALIEGKVDAAWARWVRPWTLAAWMFLTVGIAVGSWWAYYELGWGGWWFWDPVENASFMPWLVATALLHSAIVVEKRNALKVWTILLAILAFSLSLLGTFLVRSGVLTSVHAFAVDPDRGLFILLILCVFVGGALALFALRAPELTSEGMFAPVSREGALVVNNLLLAAGTVAVFIGTLYPLALETVAGTKISVGPPFFNMTFGPIMLPLLLLVPIGPMLSWKRADGWAAVQRLWAAALIAAAGAIIAFMVKIDGPILAPFAFGLGIWLIAGAVNEVAWRCQVFRIPAPAAWRRFKGLPRAAIGMAIAHAGVGVMVLGIVAVSAWVKDEAAVMHPGDSVELAGVTALFEGESPRTGPNYREEVAHFRLMIGGADVARMSSSKRVYLPGGEPTTQVGIYPFWSGDFYISIGDRTDDGGRVVRLHWNPLVPLIWIGCFIMFLGGAISLTDRRYRIGAPVRSGLLRPKAAEV